MKVKANAKPGLAAFDMAAFLDSAEAIAEYPIQVLADGEPGELLRALGHIAKARHGPDWGRYGPGTRAPAQGARPVAHPRYDTVLKVTRSLGVRRTAEPAA